MQLQLKKQVELCLTEQPESRNSDIMLTILVWQRFYSVGDTLDLKSLYYLPTQESIKRVRAQFNQRKRYMPTDPEVIRNRRLQAEAVRETLGYESKQSITTRQYEAQKLI